MLKTVFGLFAAAAALTGAATAFDNSTCNAFLVGTWAEAPKPSGRQSVMEMAAGGAFAFRFDQVAGGVVTQGKTLSTGTWSAKPGGKADSCSFTFVTADGAATNELTIGDENTYTIVGANEVYHRR